MIKGDKMDTKVQSITIIGKKWFDKVNGNTYHTAKIMVNGETVGSIPFSYGYDRMYEQNATVWLKENGYIASEKYQDYFPLSVYCRENGIHLESWADYYPRKKDITQ